MQIKSIIPIVIFTLFFSLNELKSQSNVELVTFATGFDQPVEISHAGDSRLFVIEQAGYIRIVDEQGTVNPTPFLDITDLVKSGGEQGLLCLAFHPGYSSNGFFYVNYTDNSDDTHIARFSVTDNNPDQADPNSELTLMTIAQPYQNHNGGDLAFGPDGYLYIGLGDGGSGGDPGNRAQDLSTLLGKMLRIDVDGGNPYGIPPDNPFVNDPDALDEIWAYGLRNPWRFNFDRETGDMWIGDVGQNQVEEIDFQPASSSGGENYGWRCYEGSNPYNTNGCGPQSQYVFPVFEYNHNNNGCSVTGGYMYRGSDVPQMEGHYFFADYCSDKIWSLHKEGNEWVDELFGEFPGNNFSTFGEDVNGELYIAGISSGTIFKFKDLSSGMIDNKPGNLEIYPNPFRHNITIGSGSELLSPLQLTITDLHGNEIYKDQLKDTNIVDLDFLDPGVYIISVEKDGKVTHEKLFKR